MTRFIKRRWPVIILVALALGAGGLYVACGRHMPARATTAARGKALYRCPMHPSYTSEKPGECPICGMKLVPVKQQQAAKQVSTTAAGAAPAPMVAGQAMVQLSPEKQQLIGLRTGVVERVPLTKVIRTVGQITADETRVSRVYTKVEGWVEKLYVNFTGDLVRKGQPLLAIYSPELVATQEEYLLALRAQKRLKDSEFEEVAGGGRSLLAATRRRLQLWDVPESEIRRIEQAGEPIKTITLYAPTSGYVMEKAVLEGQKVDAATPLMTVADLGVVWMEAEFYEADVPLVRAGERARITVNAYPGKSWSGTIDYIYPTVDPQTRTMRARLRVANPSMTLRPGMYANVEMEKTLGVQLTVPQEAVLDSGARKIVFIDRGDGHFEPREVKIGERTDDRVVIESGLQAGERIVTSGNFLVDSESRLQSAIEGMAPMPGMEHGTKTGKAGAKQPTPGPTQPTAPENRGMPGMPGM